MAAAVGAAITPAKMIIGGEDHPARIEIKIAGQDFWRGDIVRFAAMKFHHALVADAGLVSQIRRHLREQRFGDFHFGAPARAFVGGRRAKLAAVWLMAQRTLAVIDRFAVHGRSARTRENAWLIGA